MIPDTIPARLMKQASSRPNAPAYYVKDGGRWKPTTWRDYADHVRQAAQAFLAAGFKPGDNVAILGFNRPEWVIFDLAVMSIGGCAAGIYTTCSPTEVEYIINHSEARYVLLEDAGQWEKVKQQRENLTGIEKVVMMKGAPKIDDDLVWSWEEFMASGSDINPEDVDTRISELDEDSLATLIYTSGTTGPPKGVMLSHRNLAWTSKIASALVEQRRSDSTLSYLPLSHIAEQVFTIHGPVSIGSQVYFAESIEKVPDNLKEVQPTIVFAVPRIWEKFYAGINAKLKDAKPVKKKLVAWAINVGQRYHRLKFEGQDIPLDLELQFRAARKLIYSKLKPALGLGRARFCVTGAAPISKEILEFFSGLDLIIYEVYGQSEDTGPTSFNRPGFVRFGTVGPAIPGVDVRLAEDGEICVRGTNVFSGYYKDEEATNDALIDGWLHSGDLGSFDADGFLSITGRKKEIIITAGGKNIAPKNIEAALKNHPLITEAVVIGDRRKYLSSLIVLDPEAAAKFAQDNGLPASNLHENAQVVETIQSAVNEVNTLFARVEQIKKFKITPRPFTVEDGELTPTLKVKRKKVNEHFSELIESMYA